MTFSKILGYDARREDAFRMRIEGSDKLLQDVNFVTLAHGDSLAAAVIQAASDVHRRSVPEIAF
jgi:hypothetical protein